MASSVDPFTKYHRVRVLPYSDGDASRWPTNPLYQRVSCDLYRAKIADMWKKDLGQIVKGKHYILDRLPTGYALFEKRRLNDASAVDKYLFGCPAGKTKGYFTSPAQFYKHFKHLMSHGQATPSVCSCKNCRHMQRVRLVKDAEAVNGVERSSRQVSNHANDNVTATSQITGEDEALNGHLSDGDPIRGQDDNNDEHDEENSTCDYPSDADTEELAEEEAK